MDIPMIEPDDIIEEANEILAEDQQNTIIPPNHVLDEILEALKPVDFRKEAKLDEGEKISQKVLLVVVVQQVLRVAMDLAVGLRRHADFLYTYNGEFWQLIGRAELESFLGQAAARLGVDEITSEYHLFRTNLMKQFFATAYLPTPTLPVGKVLINLLNGTFEITGKLRAPRKFSADDFLTYQLPFPYDEKATCPKWKKFLDRVLPDKSCQKVLAEYFAYIFTTLKLEKTLLLFGTGANGKSVVFDVLRKLLGTQNITHFSLSSLTNDYHRACLVNKLLNYASEISSKLEANIFKTLSSGEPINARLPYGQPFILDRYAKLAFNCNELPKDVECSPAFFRRFLIIPFRVFISEEERNPNLAEEIVSEELSGVFNWILEGLERLQAQGNFSYCEEAENIVDEYRKESDSVALFVEDAGYQKVSCKEEGTLLKDFYAGYRLYCVDNGFRAVSTRSLRSRLEVLGFECQRTNAGKLVYATAAKNKDY